MQKSAEKVSFKWSITMEFCPQTQKLELHYNVFYNIREKGSKVFYEFVYNPVVSCLYKILHVIGENQHS